MTSNTRTFTLSSSDVIQEMKVTVNEGGKPVWYQERTLTETEIVESVIDAQTSSLRWTIHKPKRGWYIRLRSPSFPPGAFINLIPEPSPNKDPNLAGLSFGCRTLPPKTPVSGVSGVHSYPPSASSSPITSPRESLVPIPQVTISVAPPEPAEENDISSAPPTGPTAAASGGGGSPARRRPPPMIITHFTILPSTTFPSLHLHLHTIHTTTSSLFSRFRSSVTLHNSFVIEPKAPTPYPPVVTYNESTSTFSLASSTGTLVVDTEVVAALGVELSFWIAAALAFVGFVSDRQSYLAAASD